MTSDTWCPPDGWTEITTVDAHAAGEPLRVITGGWPTLEGTTILERRRFARDHFDHLRTALMWEPRGHADMYGCLVTPPVSEGAHVSVLFLHNEGYSTMCGHGIIAVTTVLLETGRLPITGPRTEVRIAETTERDVDVALIGHTVHVAVVGRRTRRTVDRHVVDAALSAVVSDVAETDPERAGRCGKVGGPRLEAGFTFDVWHGLPVGRVAAIFPTPRLTSKPGHTTDPRATRHLQRAGGRFIRKIQDSLHGFAGRGPLLLTAYGLSSS